MPLQSLQPHKHDANTCSAMRFHRLILYCSLNACKTHQELLAKARHNSPALPLRAAASTFFLPAPQPLIDYQSHSQTSPLCNARRKAQPPPPAQKPKEISSGTFLPSIHGLTLFLHSSASTMVLPLSLPSTVCLGTAAPFHLNVNELPQICSARPVSLLSHCYLCYVTEM